MTKHQIYNFAKKIIKYKRSLTGIDNLKTLKDIKKVNKNLNIKSFSSGLKFFDWTIPYEWEIKDGYIITPSGNKICDFKKSCLHVIGYSIRISKTVSKTELNKHLYSLKNQPHAIPYVTSYYKKNWGFCIDHKTRSKLDEGKYKVFIDSKFKKGKMVFGEYIIKGKSKKEILLSTYICHPEMANNETSGISVLTFLANWISKKKRNFTYRIIFIPETIGSIAYISKNLKTLKKKLIAGYVVTCVGDENLFSYIPSRSGDSPSDYVAKLILKKYYKKFKKYSWLDRGSDERQFCSPGLNLPVCSVTKSKYGKFKEYHTSLDSLDTVVTSKGLNESFKLYKRIINFFEKNNNYKSFFPKSVYLCEPQLSKRKMYPSISFKKQSTYTRNMMNVLSYCDGNKSIEQIANLTKNNIYQTKKILKKLKSNKIIS